jgi:hypothetical protein
MPRQNVLLFIEPEQHYLIYGSSVVREIVAAHARPGYTIRELKASQALPDTINASLSELDPIFFWGVGHGNTGIYSVECKTVYMRTCDANAARMAGRVVHLNSCLTAVSLGPDLINDKHALTYFGSNQEFWFYIGSGPGTDRASKTVFLAEYQVEASLMDGKNTGQAKADQMAKYDEEIAYWTTGEGKTHPHAADLARILQIDKSIATMLGRDDVVVCPSAPPPPGVMPGMSFLMVLPMLFGGIIFGRQMEKK